MATQYAPIAKDSSINTTEQTPRNIADVLAEELSAIEQAIAGGSGSGGHVIEDTNGTALTQRADLQFVGVYTEDDSANDRTKVNVVRTMTKAQMDALSAAEKVGFIRTSDEADNPYQCSGSVSVTADGAKTYSDILNALYALVDSSKVSYSAKLVKIRYSDGQKLIFHLVDVVSNIYIFTYSYVYASNDAPTESMSMTSSSSKFARMLNGTFTDNSSSIPASGDVFTLYYR